MQKRYSTYEAKARLSELLNRVRKGDVVTITHRGQPVAEVRRIDASDATLKDRLEALERSGILTHRAGKVPFKPLARKAGALQRFLKSRE
ncbi:MAG TPA: type II toxin-antitoxin system prevent-host-death family antitoxin [Thermoanaerobaculia bacterium]|nr:type II toxin-antitoxin system prevent-host-death family antitoxin [Thermoanaerobaculia bacterium]